MQHAKAKLCRRWLAKSEPDSESEMESKSDAI